MNVSVNMDAAMKMPPEMAEYRPHVEPVGETREAQVERAWVELGYKVRPLFAKVFVVTDAPLQKIGLLWLPPKVASFYGGLGHQRLVTATVLSCGPGAKYVKPADRVCFARLQFGHIAKLPGERYVGWIEQEQIAGVPEDGAFEPWNG
jgi:hypothetical protein